MPKPHVVMFGGRFTFVQDWARAAAAAGAEVSLVEGQKRPSSVGTPSNPSSEVAVRNYENSLKFRPSRVFWPLNERLSERSIRHFMTGFGAGTRPVTHLHTHFYSGAHIVTRIADDLGLPLIHTEHSSAIIGGHVSRRGRLNLLEICEQAKTVFAVSEPLADAMCDLGVAREIEVVPNPVNLELFASRQPTAEYPVAEHGGRFVTIGWLIPRKDHAAILRAFAAVMVELPRSSLTIIGDGKLRSELLTLSESLGIAGSVRFLGSLDRVAVARILDESHCYIHASKAETFGVTLVEAWGAGLPVVTFPCGGVSGLADVIGGTVVTQRDDGLLAQAMVEQVRTASLDQRFDVRRRAAERFAPSAVAKALAGAYDVL